MSEMENFQGLFDTEKTDSEIDIIKMFYDKKNINMKTEIPDGSIVALCAIEALSKIVKKQGLTITSTAIDGIITEFKEVMVSRNREGRKEGQSFLGAVRDKLKQNSLFAKMLGAGNQSNSAGVPQ